MGRRRGVPAGCRPRRHSSHRRRHICGALPHGAQGVRPCAGTAVLVCRRRDGGAHLLPLHVQNWRLVRALPLPVALLLWCAHFCGRSAQRQRVMRAGRLVL